MISTSYKKILAPLLLFIFVCTTLLLPIQNANAQEDPGWGEIPDAVMYDVDENPTTQDSGDQCLVDAAFDFLTNGLFSLASTALSAIPGIGDFLGGLFGGADQVVELNLEKMSIKACFKGVKDQLLRVAFTKFKKRLLDRITDDIIGWIQDGRDPKFISDFSGFLEEGGQAAFGDVLQEVGLGNLCSPIQRAQIIVGITPTKTFSEAVSCTLDSVVGNIDAFYKDFSQGGLIGYQEVWKPSNNIYGLLIQSSDEVLRRATAENAERLAQAQSSGGYRNVQECREWTRNVKRISTGEIRRDTIHPGTGIGARGSVTTNLLWEDAFLSVNNPPPNVGTLIPYVVIGPWNCTDKRTTIPEATVADAANKALVGADIDYINNTDDLSPYMNAIFDAAINRLVRAGVEGLQSIGKSDPERKPYDPTDPRDQGFIDATRDDIEATDIRAQLVLQINKRIATTRALISQTRPLIPPGINANLTLITSLTLLRDCEYTRLPQAPAPAPLQACSSTKTSLEEANARAAQFTTLQSTLTQIDANLTDIQSTITANPDLPELTLQGFLGAVDTAWNSVSTIKDSLTGISTAITAERTETNTQLNLCRFPDPIAGYSCAP